MPYCTIDQLTDRYSAALLIGLSDRGEEPAEAIDADLFARAIADADALVDGYLKTRYALPLSATPAVVSDISQRVAIYYAHGQSVPDKIREDYKEALRQLQQIAQGLMTLDVAGAEPAGSGGGEVILTEEDLPFTRPKMKGFI